VDDAELDAYVEAFVSRIASFDKRTVRATKVLINRIGIAKGDELLASNRAFFQALTQPGTLNRCSKPRGLGYGKRSHFALNFGKALKSFGS